MTRRDVDEYAKAIADSLPPLTAEQRDELRRILSGVPPRTTKAAPTGPPVATTDRRPQEAPNDHGNTGTRRTA